MYAWLVKYQDVISGFIAGVCLMSAADYFVRGDVWYGVMSLIIAAVNLMFVNTKIGQHGQPN
jgi:hypothetical protein